MSGGRKRLFELQEIRKSRTLKAEEWREFGLLVLMNNLGRLDSYQPQKKHA